jgi:hypothetical protein
MFSQDGARQAAHRRRISIRALVFFFAKGAPSRGWHWMSDFHFVHEHRNAADRPGADRVEFSTWVAPPGAALAACRSLFREDLAAGRVALVETLTTDGPVDEARARVHARARRHARRARRLDPLSRRTRGVTTVRRASADRGSWARATAVRSRRVIGLTPDASAPGARARRQRCGREPRG